MRMRMNGKGDKWRGGWNQQYANNFDSIFNKRDSSMQYELVQKQSKEVINKTNANTIEEAKQFFMSRKNMNEKQLDALYYVQKTQIKIKK